MNNFRFNWRILIFTVVVFVLTGSARAQATRTWVSGVGDDANPCSRTAPCKTFAGAISKTVKGGEINCLDAGGFGAVTITKSVTIDGTAVMSAILGPSMTGININITDAADPGVVRIRGLTLNGTGTGTTGIKISAASKVSIENTIIDGFTDGIVAATTGGKTQVFVKDGSIRNIPGTAISAAAAGNQIALSNVSVVFNNRGLATSAGGTIVSFKNNIFFANTTDGEPTSTLSLR